MRSKIPFLSFGTAWNGAIKGSDSYAKLRRNHSPTRSLVAERRVSDDFGDLLAAAVTPEQIDKYIERRLAGKRGAKGELIPGDRPASINRSLQLLGQCFNLI